jgi:ADP-ribose pyrophosphatase YjhB (NUDIX family)
MSGETWDGDNRRMEVGHYEREIGELKATVAGLGDAVKDGFSRIERKIDDNIRRTNEEIERIDTRLEQFKGMHDQADRDKFTGVYNRILQVETRQATIEAWKAAQEQKEETERREAEKSRNSPMEKFKDVFTKTLYGALATLMVGGLGWLAFLYLSSLSKGGITP